jgi:hypothetical protein
MNIYRGAAYAVVLVVSASSLSGQTSSTQLTPDSSYVLMLDHDFTGPDEFVRVFLQDGQVYRVELNSPNVALEVRGVVRTTQAPHVYPFLASQTPSGSTLLEIYPERDAEYEIRSRGISGNQLPTRLRLYRDVEASTRRQHVRTSRAYEIGLEVGGGWHSGFVQSGGMPIVGTDPEGGTDVEGCLTARGAAESSRFRACVFGVSYQSQRGARSITWVYSEPRFRLVGGRGMSRSGWELGPLFRFGVGIISASSQTPVVIAPGAYIARLIGTSSHQGGWTIQASYTRPFYKGFSRPTGLEAATPKGHRLVFGIGWYR